MELVDENWVIDLIENQKLSYEQAISVLKERFPVCRVFRPGLLEDFVAKGEYLQECLLTEMVMEASNKVISAF